VTRDISAATNRLVAGTVTKYLLLAVNVATGIFLMPFTVRHLGQAEYGLWMLVASTTYYFQLLDMGYGNGIVRHIVAADRQQDVLTVNQIVSTFFCIYAAVGIAACFVSAAVIAVVVPRFPRLTPAQVRTAQAILAIISVRLAIGFPMTVFGAVTNARQGFVWNNAVAIATVMTSACVTWIVLEAGYGLVPLVAATTAVNVLGYVGYAVTARRVFPPLAIRPSLFSRAQWREVTSFSVYLFLIQLAGQISFNIDTVVVGAFVGTAAVAVYTVALRLSEYQRRVCDQFSGMLFPVVVRFGADGDVHALRQTLVEGTRVAVTLVAAVSACLIGFSGPLIRHWMGPAFDESVAPFVLLALAGVIVVSQAAVCNVLIAVGSHRLLAFVWLAEAAANFALSLLFVRRFGLAGVALGTVLPLVFGHLFVLLPRACRAVSLDVWTCVRDTTRPAVVGAAAATFACLVIRQATAAATARVVLAQTIVTTAVYFGAVAAFGFTPDVRTRYLDQARTLYAWAAVRSARRRTHVET